MNPSDSISILLVDDHFVVRKSVSELLKKRFENADFHFAQNGLEALDILGQFKINLVLLDVSMPEMDGYQTLPRIKKGYPEIKVIMLTSHDADDLILHFLGQGVNGFFCKADSENLIDVVQRVLDNGKYFGPKVAEVLEKHLAKEKSDGEHSPSPSIEN